MNQRRRAQGALEEPGITPYELVMRACEALDWSWREENDWATEPEDITRSYKESIE